MSSREEFWNILGAGVSVGVPAGNRSKYDWTCSEVQETSGKGPLTEVWAGLGEQVRDHDAREMEVGSHFHPALKEQEEEIVLWKRCSSFKSGAVVEQPPRRSGRQGSRTQILREMQP